MRRFAYAGDGNHKYIVKSPCSGTNRGMVSTDTVWDNYELSLGFRVMFRDVSGTQYLFDNTEQAVAKNENWSIYLTAGELYWNDPTSGAVKLLGSIVSNVLYTIWLDISEDTIDINCESSQGFVNDSVAKSAYYSTDSYMCVLNQRAGAQYLFGTMFDIVAIGGLGYGFDLFRFGGVAWNSTTKYWTCREGIGTGIYDRITGLSQLYAGHFTGFDWNTIVQDNCKKWS